MAGLYAGWGESKCLVRRRRAPIVSDTRRPAPHPMTTTTSNPVSAPAAPRTSLPAPRAPAAVARVARVGVISGLAAYLAWGFVPLFFTRLSHVPPLGVLTHRSLWSSVSGAITLRLQSKWPATA